MYFIIVMLLVCWPAYGEKIIKSKDAQVIRVAFGSTYDLAFDPNGDIFETILSTMPDNYIWLSKLEIVVSP